MNKESEGEEPRHVILSPTTPYLVKVVIPLLLGNHVRHRIIHVLYQAPTYTHTNIQERKRDRLNAVKCECKLSKTKPKTFQTKV